MLTLTDNAVTAIRALISQPEQAPDAGLRIMGQGEGVPPFQLALAETPADGDQVIEADGARITTTLLHEFRRRGAGRAAATMCIGVGQGIATLWESA